MSEKSAVDTAASSRREITTYLVRVNDQWLVDYQRTRESMTEPSPFSGLKGDISRLREQFDDAVGRSSEQISERMDQLAKDFEAYSDETGKKAEKTLESFRESLENLRKEIEESMDEARKNREESEESGQESLEQAAI
jgi:DNA anti-recombination protein RmuC